MTRSNVQATFSASVTVFGVIKGKEFCEFIFKLPYLTISRVVLNIKAVKKEEKLLYIQVFLFFF
jgi:hypothetical protein